MNESKNKGYLYALVAACLFGASTPAAKPLLQQTSPWLLAGLLYFGSGIGLGLISFLRLKKEASLRGKDWYWISGAVLFGGILAPLLLMTGLSKTNAGAASLFLNFEAVFTAVVSWYFFKEHFDRRIFIGMLFILCGGFILSWTKTPTLENSLGPFLIALACLGWAIDNNLTRKISASDPLQIATIKSLLAGSTNILLAFFFVQDGHFPAIKWLLTAGVIGFFGYGVSLLCFILALRHIGTSRTGAYFSLTPFVGALLSLLFLHEPISYQFILASLFMGIGLWLHLTENHSHEHTHEILEHEHQHIHDEHHQHAHSPNDPLGEPHSHKHRHEVMTHTHRHYPDIHHRHSH